MVRAGGELEDRAREYDPRALDHFVGIITDRFDVAVAELALVAPSPASHVAGHEEGACVRTAGADRDHGAPGVHVTGARR